MNRGRDSRFILRAGTENQIFSLGAGPIGSGTRSDVVVVARHGQVPFVVLDDVALLLVHRVDRLAPVSYTHLTLPTIYSV